MTDLRHDVEFESRGATLRGWLYRVDDGMSRPGVVMAHGFTAVKEMFLDRYAEAFARAGFTTLVYDHYGFGDSDGEPRQSPADDLQLQGYRDAVAWLAADELVDQERIGIWGSSLSGGEVITLASEPLPIACAVAQAPYLGEGGPDLPSGALDVIAEAVGSGRTDATMAAVSATPDGEGAMFEDGAHDWFTRNAATRAPNWRDEVHVGGFIASGRHKPIANLAKARVPLLLIVGSDDHLTPPGPALPIAATTPNVTVVEVPGGHFDVYERGFEASSEHAIEWFRQHLGG